VVDFIVSFQALVIKNLNALGFDLVLLQVAGIKKS
jgi:hypothetical protein